MWDMPWTASETLIERRTDEEFLKHGRGYPTIEFTIPMNWIDIIDIFTNIRLQEPFGLDASGDSPERRGEYGRYYYIASLTYDFMNQKITILGIDLQFLIAQCMIVASCDWLSSDDWADASQADRMYAYVGNCATESFADGSPLKKVCKCIT